MKCVASYKVRYSIDRITVTYRYMVAGWRLRELEHDSRPNGVYAHASESTLKAVGD